MPRACPGREIAIAVSVDGLGVVSVLYWVPRLRAISSGRREWLAEEVVAGMVLSMLMVRQGMSYAGLTGLPPVAGRYMSILWLRGDAVSGRWRVLVPGPGSSPGPVVAATILPLTGAEGDAGRVTVASRPPTSPDPPGPMRTGRPAGTARVKLQGHRGRVTAPIGGKRHGQAKEG